MAANTATTSTTTTTMNSTSAGTDTDNTSLPVLFTTKTAHRLPPQRFFIPASWRKAQLNEVVTRSLGLEDDVGVSGVPLDKDGGKGDEDGEAEEPTLVPPLETDDSLSFKLTLLQIYTQRVQKRHESKAIMFDRGLLNYKSVRTTGKLVLWVPSDKCPF